MRPDRTEIIICTGLRTRGDQQLWGPSRRESCATAEKGLTAAFRDVLPAHGDAPLPVRLHAVRLMVRIVHPPRPGHAPASHRERTVAHGQVPEASLRLLIRRWQWGESKFLQKLVVFRR